MRETQTASEQITSEVTSWPGVTARHGRRGEFAFLLRGRQIGHLHGDASAHFSFPPELWNELKRQQRIVEHPVFPGRVGPAARPISGPRDVREVVALMRLNYDRLSTLPPPTPVQHPSRDGAGVSESGDRGAQR